MKALVVDDERLAVERLKRLLDLDRRVEVMASLTDSIETCAYLNGNCPDVLFLDIEMHEMTGFHLLAQLEVQPMVVFTTAYDQFALCAFEVNSIDYLLKPVETKRLNRAIGKVERILGGIEPRTNVIALAPELARALKKHEPAYLSRLASRIGDRVEFIDASQVTHFYIYTHEGQTDLRRHRQQRLCGGPHHRRSGEQARPRAVHPHPPRHNS